jgi:hypothetical protein
LERLRLDGDENDVSNITPKLLVENFEEMLHFKKRSRVELKCPFSDPCNKKGIATLLEQLREIWGGPIFPDPKDAKVHNHLLKYAEENHLNTLIKWLKHNPPQHDDSGDRNNKRLFKNVKKPPSNQTLRGPPQTSRFHK